MKKVLLTGGAGFIGSFIAKTYTKEGFTVVVVDKKEKPTYLQAQTYYQVDITKTGLEEVFEKEKPDVVNHHAALIHVADSFSQPVNYTETNVKATIRLLELSKKYQVAQFLFASSVAVYGEVDTFPITEEVPTKPCSFYGLDKRVAEHMIQLYSSHFKTVIFRYANVYGPRQTSSAEGGVVAIFAKALLEGRKPVIFGDGSQTRDFVFVKDVAAANVKATLEGYSGLAQVSTGKETSINALLNTMNSIADTTIEPHFAPAREGDIVRSVLSNRKIAQELGFQPRFSLEDGLQETVDYFAEETV